MFKAEGSQREDRYSKAGQLRLGHIWVGPMFDDSPWYRSDVDLSFISTAILRTLTCSFQRQWRYAGLRFQAAGQRRNICSRCPRRTSLSNRQRSSLWMKWYMWCLTTVGGSCTTVRV
jgi:hypothetical protein